MNKPAEHNHAEAVVLLMRAKAQLHDKQFEQAVATINQVLHLNPQLGEALMIRATAWVELGEYPKALADVERRLRMDPPEPIALLTRANLRAQLDGPEAALGDFTEYLRQQPAMAVALRARALCYVRLDRVDEALADLNEAVRVAPANADAYLERGRVYQVAGRYASAVPDYQTALDLEPNEARFYNQFAWMLAACPQQEYRDGARAVQLARRGCELTNWQDANLMDTLACAYAECSQFDEALTWANKSLPMASAEIKEAVAEHVQSFRDGRPARFEKVGDAAGW